MQLDPTETAELIELIYEGPLEPSPWQSFLERLRSVTNATRVSIQLYRARDADLDVRVAATHPLNDFDWRQCLEIYRQRHMDKDPGRHHSLKPRQIVTMGEYLGSDFCREFLEPNDIVHLVRTLVVEPNGLKCWLQLYGRKSMGPFDVNRDVQLLNTVLPHLERALKLYAKLMLSESEKLSYQAAISHLAFGCLIIDGEGRIIDSNAVASDLIQKHAVVSIVDGALVLRDESTSRELNRAIQEAIILRRLQKEGPFVDLMRTTCSCGAVLAFLVSLPPMMTYFQGEHTPNVVIYMCDLEARIGDDKVRRLSAELLVAKLLRLTQAEARLAMLLADGLTIAEAAIEMSVTESTARSYSKRIFEKTSIKRQTDLVRLIYRSVALLA